MLALVPKPSLVSVDRHTIPQAPASLFDTQNYTILRLDIFRPLWPRHYTYTRSPSIYTIHLPSLLIETTYTHQALFLRITACQLLYLTTPEEFCAHANEVLGVLRGLITIFILFPAACFHFTVLFSGLLSYLVSTPLSMLGRTMMAHFHLYFSSLFLSLYHYGGIICITCWQLFFFWVYTRLDAARLVRSLGRRIGVTPVTSGRCRYSSPRGTRIKDGQRLARVWVVLGSRTRPGSSG